MTTCEHCGHRVSRLYPPSADEEALEVMSWEHDPNCRSVLLARVEAFDLAGAVTEAERATDARLTVEADKNAEILRKSREHLASRVLR